MTRLSAGIAVGRGDNIWIVHRPASLLDDEKGALKNLPETKCCTPAPHVMQFDRAGNLLRMAGELGWVHNLAIDSKGDLYTADVGFGRRAQKFVRQ